MSENRSGPRGPPVGHLTPKSSNPGSAKVEGVGHNINNASTCKRGGDAVFRHNRLRDVVAESCRLAHLIIIPRIYTYLTWLISSIICLPV